MYSNTLIITVTSVVEKNFTAKETLSCTIKHVSDAIRTVKDWISFLYEYKITP